MVGVAGGAGFSDPVYAEAYVTVHQYDIVLDVSVQNRTTATLQNLNLELATMGDLKLVERPQNHTLGPGASKTIRANIKVWRPPPAHCLLPCPPLPPRPSLQNAAVCLSVGSGVGSGESCRGATVGHGQ